MLETRPVTAGEAELLAVLPRFVGPQMQVPPMYSAVKVNGQPLYKAARQGITVERKARPIEIYSIRYEGSPAPGEYALTVRCSKGTYIRTLLEDIAAGMGQLGAMSALRRTQAGLFTEAGAHTLEEILAAKEAGPEALAGLLLAGGAGVRPLPLLTVDRRTAAHLYNGCPTSRYPAADGRYRVRDEAGAVFGPGPGRRRGAAGGKTVRGTDLRNGKTMQIYPSMSPLQLGGKQAARWRWAISTASTSGTGR